MNRRAGAAQAASGAAATLRGQDVDVSKLNADYANRFNEMVTGRQTMAAADAAAARNVAGQKRSDTKQRVGEMNAAARTDSDWRNMQYGNDMAQQEYENEYNKANALYQAYTGRGARQDRQKAMKDWQIMGVGEGLGKAGGGTLDFLAQMYGGGGIG
jgi:hypothetical protein